MKDTRASVHSIQFDLSQVKSFPFEISATESKDFVHQKMLSSPSFYYLTWIEEGSGSYMIDFLDYPVKPFRLYILLPNQLHAWQVNKDFKATSLYFLEESLFISQQKNILEELELLQYQRRLPFVDIPSSELESFQRFLEDLKQEDKLEQLGQTIMLQAQLHRLLIKAQRVYADLSFTALNYAASSAQKLTRKFQDLVNQKGFKSFSVQDYAQSLHVSPKYLADVVKAETGQPPSVHIRRRLSLEAKRIIAHSNNSAQSVAYELGFEDPAYFGRFFKREVGMTPKQFRIKIRTKYQNL